MSESDKDVIRHEYLINGLNANEIYKKHFIGKSTPVTIQLNIKRMKISRGKGRGMYNIKVNHSYFNVIDTCNKAYILGYITADGSITKNLKTISFECLKKDKEVLEFIKSEIYTDAKIKKMNRTNTDRERNDTVYMRIHSIDLVKDLIKHGVYYNKSYKNFNLPNLSDNLLPDYIRAIFDADGTVYKTKKRKTPFVSICGNETFLKDIELLLKNKKIISKENNIIDMNKYGFNVFHLRITRKKDIRAFYEYIYYGEKFKLESKFNKFTKLLNEE